MIVEVGILILCAGVGVLIASLGYSEKWKCRLIEKVMADYYNGRKEVAVELIKRGITDEEELKKRLDAIFPEPNFKE